MVEEDHRKRRTKTRSTAGIRYRSLDRTEMKEPSSSASAFLGSLDLFLDTEMAISGDKIVSSKFCSWFSTRGWFHLF